MTAVAPPLTSTSRLGWSPNAPADNFSGIGMSDDRMFPPSRRTVQRANSGSSMASTNSNTSSTSTISASSVQTNGTSIGTTDGGSWATRRKPSRGLWPPSKSEPATGLTPARSHAVTSSAPGLTASSAISALQTPVLPSQPLVNGAGPQNGMSRNQPALEPQAILHLLPMNGTFERKTITVPFYPDLLRIGRQTNQKTLPTPLNGYFDSKVLSRQHAEVWADRQGRIFIRDVKSSNGTFVNGLRLSQENKESEPRELREQDLLELGIDIVSEDQKTVVHHKVAAKVEHAGVYGQTNDPLNYGDLDPGPNTGGLTGVNHGVKRGPGPSPMSARGLPSSQPPVHQGPVPVGVIDNRHLRNWLNPCTPEHLMNRMHNEMKFALRQSQELARAKQAIEVMLGNKPASPIKEKEVKWGSDRSRSSPVKPRGDLKAHFTEPPAPPPQTPLPEKPDFARAFVDPIMFPSLRRNDTARPPSVHNSPTFIDYSGEVQTLYEELHIAKGELTMQSMRMTELQNELAEERRARETAEDRAQRLERRDSIRAATTNSMTTEADAKSTLPNPAPGLQDQLTRLENSMAEMKQQMEAYRQRAEKAETERDQAQQSLAEMVEQKRKENAKMDNAGSPGRMSKAQKKESAKLDGSPTEPNGPDAAPSLASPTSETLREHAGLEEGQPITQQQAKIINHLLTQEVLGPQSMVTNANLTYYGRPYGSAAAVVILGFLVMTYVNGWPKVER